jgi:hypothetical protein
MPVIAAMEVGRGRSVAVTTDSTWNWGLPALASKGAMRHYFTFWHNVLRWLIKDPEMNPVKIRTDRDNYEPGERVQVSITVLDRAYKPAPHIPVRMKLTGPAPVVPPIKPETVTNEIGYCETSFTPTTTGVYVLEAIAAAKDGSTHTAQETLLVQRSGPELRDVTINRELLADLAQKSGGRAIELPAKTFPAGIRIADPYIARVLEKEDIALWDNWLVLGLLVGLLSLEWWIRKRAGLP